MRIRHVLQIAGGVACIAAGFLIGQRLDSNREERRALGVQQRHEQELSAQHDDASKWAESVATEEGASILRAFVAGISSAVLTRRNEDIELAAVNLLHVQGVAGIHVMTLQGGVLYSSDAKLTATGDAKYRGEWALKASELLSRPSARSGLLDIAMPIISDGARVAVTWLEYDMALVRDAARPETLRAPVTPPVPDPIAAPSLTPEPPAEALQTAPQSIDEESSADAPKRGGPQGPQ